jgi:hypothetical protein
MAMHGRTCLDVVQQNSESFPDAEKTMTPTCASQSTESSYAFLRSPFRRLQNVTCRCGVLSIRFTHDEIVTVPPPDLSFVAAMPDADEPPHRAVIVTLLGGGFVGCSEGWGRARAAAMAVRPVPAELAAAAVAMEAGIGPQLAAAAMEAGIGPQLAAAEDETATAGEAEAT